MSGSVSLIDGHIDEVRICPICGKTFAPHHVQQKYCSLECAHEAKLRMDRQHKTEIRHRDNKPESEPVVLPRASVKSKPLGALSGDELLNYGAVQKKMNADALRVTVPNDGRINDA